MYYSIKFEDRHWNHNAACFIPAAWVAFIEDENTGHILRVHAATERDCIAAVKTEYPNAQEA